jgi:hypothetical protein
MTYSPLSLSRRHVLGDLYPRCEAINESVPVYLAGEERELLGHVDQALGHYADAFSFHLADDVCKKLSAGQFTYSFDYDYADPASKGSRGRIKLMAITLNARKTYQKPVSK